MKAGKQNSLDVIFNISDVASSCPQKYLGLLLNKRLIFNEHIQSKMNSSYKMISVWLSSDDQNDFIKTIII